MRRREGGIDTTSSVASPEQPGEGTSWPSLDASKLCGFHPAVRLSSSGKILQVADGGLPAALGLWSGIWH